MASSVATEKLLKALGIPVLDLNAAGQIGLYVDGADEANQYGYLIKGLGGALTREKIHPENGRVRLPGAELIFPEDLPFELIESACSPVYGQEVPNLCLRLHVRAYEKWTLPWEFRPA